MVENSEQRNAWWQTYDLPADTWVGWEIGPLQLYARQDPSEWSFKWRRDPNPLADAVSFAAVVEAKRIAEDHETARYGLAHGSGKLQLRPLLADLPVIARPANSLFIPPHQQTTLYVTTVLWLQAVNEDTLLMELPVFRPSDTWFGADTIEGELCYASRTQARTSQELLIHLPHRAVTPIAIVNEADTSLQIQQLRVPVPFLSLYAAPDGQLWTDRIRLTRAADSTEASLELLGRDQLPAGCDRIAEPRQEAPHQSLVRAFSRLFE